MNSPYELPDVPWSNEAEQSVIGGLLLNNEAIDRVGQLAPNDFYSGSHQEIMRHVLRLIGANKPADVVTVFESLHAAGRAEYVGGLAYLGEIANNCPSAANVARYAESVRDKSVLRRLLAAGGEIQSLVAARDGLSAADKMQRAQALVMDLAEQSGGEHAPKLMADIIPRWLDRFKERMERQAGTVAGIPTGIAEIDRRYHGVERGRVYVIAGRPGMGKTTLALNIAEYIGLDQKIPVLICSQEMPDVELAQCFVASVGRLDKERLNDAQLTEDEFERLTYAVARINEAPVMIDEQAGLTMANVQTKARQAQRQMGKLGLIVIDYLQLMVGEGDNQNEKIGGISRSVKQLARDFDCPVFLISQLNRKCEERPDKRPVSSDLRDSGSIEQDADVIWFVYRDEVYNANSMDKGLAELGCSKHRMGGQNGKVTPLLFKGEYGRFESLDGGLPSWSAPKEEPRRRHRGMD
jgi:replicative DNA helicase